MATATAVATPQEQAREIDERIAKLKDSIIEHEAELNLLQVKARRASAGEIPPLLRRREIVEANLDRDRALLNEEMNRSAALWATIRSEEEAARHQTRMAEPEKLKAETLRAIADYRAGLAALNPETTTIQNGLRGLRRITDSVQINRFPYPPEASRRSRQ